MTCDSVCRAAHKNFAVLVSMFLVSPDGLIRDELAMRKWEGLQTGTMGGQLRYQPMKSPVWFQHMYVCMHVEIKIRLWWPIRDKNQALMTNNNNRIRLCWPMRGECSPVRWSCQWWGHTLPDPSAPVCGKIGREPGTQNIWPSLWKHRQNPYDKSSVSEETETSALQYHKVETVVCDIHLEHGL